MRLELKSITQLKKQQYDRQYYLTHKKQQSEQAKEYYISNRVARLKYAKEYRECHKNDKEYLDRKHRINKRLYYKYRTEKLAWQKENHKKERIKFLKMVGGCKCRICGHDDWRALQIDHVYGDGAEERRKYGSKGISRKEQSRLIKENPEKYQILCSNCNWIKKYENKETRRITNQEIKI